jgi:putative transposase
MSRYRLEPAREQEAVLLRHCADARYVWNLCIEQESWWRPGRGTTPGFAERCRQLTEARADNPWLARGSVIVQQQAVRDHDQAMRNFFAGTHRRPRWRKAGRDEGFRIVHLKPGEVRRLNRRWGEVKIPKAGWGRFRWSRAVPQDAKSFRVTRDLAGRWHVAFATIPGPVPAPGNGEADRRRDWYEKTSTGLARRFDVIRVEDLKISNMTRSARGTRDAPGRNVRQKAGLNRGISRSGWCLLVRRLEDKAPGRVERVSPAFTSQRCVACAYTENADVNAAKNIAAGHAVTARGGLGVAQPENREPQPELLPAT